MLAGEPSAASERRVSTLSARPLWCCCESGIRLGSRNIAVCCYSENELERCRRGFTASHIGADAASRARRSGDGTTRGRGADGGGRRQEPGGGGDGDRGLDCGGTGGDPCGFAAADGAVRAGSGGVQASVGPRLKWIVVPA